MDENTMSTVILTILCEKKRIATIHIDEIAVLNSDSHLP